jgi:3',5'-nucleoside bisphosphate phosphatase
VLIDFHTHTTASDGTLSPSELIDRALASNIELLAITDHDTVAGYQAAATYYNLNPGQMRLLSGVEFSCRWSGATLHIVGLGMDCDHPTMKSGLRTMALAREARGEKIADRLEALGYVGALRGALEKVGSGQLGRPHFAQWLVEQGHVADTRRAFDRYLGRGKTGDVKTFWPDLAEVVSWITNAGGVAVIAHPLQYRFTRTKLCRLIVDFKDSGGTAIEIVNGRQSGDQVAQLKRAAAQYNLLVSAGSDFHRESPYGAQLGVELRALGDLQGVWEHWTAPKSIEVHS